VASDVPAGAVVPAVDTTFRPAAVNDVLAPGRLRSIGRGAMRVFAAVLLATCIGVAGIAWQHYGDAAQQMVADWMPQLALTSLLPSEQPAPSAQPAPPAVQADTATSAPAQPAPPAPAAAQVVAPSTAALPADSAQSLQSMARDLASMGQEIGQLKASIEQLKASQQQMSRDIAKASEVKTSEVKASEIKPSEPNLQPRITAPLPRPAPAPARKPKPPPPLAAAAPTSPPATAPLPRQIEPPPRFFLPAVIAGGTDQPSRSTRKATRVRNSRPMHRRKQHRYSITSSASCCKWRGTSRPSAFAVFRLMMSSILLGCSTGKSPGLAPFRILSM